MNTSAIPRPLTKDEPVTTAAEYAAIIADEIRALEIVLDGPSDEYDSRTPYYDTDDDATYRAAMETLGFATWGDPTEALDTYLNETILEVIAWHGSNGTTRTEWLRTYGGPTCQIFFDGSDYAEIVSTGDDNNTARVSVYVPTLAAQVDELAEMARA